MNFIPGKYLIIDKAHWTREDSNFIIIKSVDEQNDEVVYFYPEDERGSYRIRDFFDFYEIKLVPCSSLTDELV